MPTLLRRQWSVIGDDRSREVGWVIGSKVYRSRVEEGKFGPEFHYDFALPWSDGKSLSGWRVGLPQFYKGVPYDGRLLRLDWPHGDKLYLEFFYEPTGVPGSLLCELMAHLDVIPAEEMNDAQQVGRKAHQAHVPKLPDSERRRQRQAV
jgi:hypothetical protein